MNVGISLERFYQLKQISEIWNESMAGAIDIMINKAIVDNGFDDSIPGFLIKRDGEFINIMVSDVKNPDRFIKKKYSLLKAIAVADRIEKTAKPIRIASSYTMRAHFDMDFCVTRVGKGIKLYDPMNGVSRVISPSIANDVARLIKKAAG